MLTYLYQIKIDKIKVDEFFEIIRQRYETNSVIVTTNRPFEEWGNIFGDVVLASAIIDRLIHHSHISKINGESCRIIHDMATLKFLSLEL
jgi:DNA replication protein DnaC